MVGTICRKHETPFRPLWIDLKEFIVVIIPQIRQNVNRISEKVSKFLKKVGWGAEKAGKWNKKRISGSFLFWFF